MWRICALSLCALTFLACANNSIASPTDNVKQEFVGAVTRDWSAYEVCEHYVRGEDRAAYFRKVLGLAASSLSRVVESRDITARQTSAGPANHLGVVELEFATPMQAQAFAQTSGTARYFAESKILTRYIALAKDRRALVLYSETHLRESVQRFLDDATRSAGQIWGAP